jgi:hypothetical protein
MNTIKNLFIISLLLLINPVFAQFSDETLTTNPLMELYGTNAKTLALKGNVTQMRIQQFLIDEKGNKSIDTVTFSNLYKFDKNGLTQEFEQNYKDLQSKKNYFSYTNKGYVSHIDIETINFLKDKDTSDTNLINQSLTPDYSTVDYKYVHKKNILFKGEDFIEGMPKKTTARKEYFYHFNDENQIFQIDYQTSDLAIKYNYDTNGLLKESLTLKSGLPFSKNIYKYDRNSRLTNITTINSATITKYPSEETVISYKLDSNGNAIEKKVKNYLYSPEGNKKFNEGYLYLYNYTYL